MSLDEVFLQERVIPLRTVDVEATAAPLDIARDLPQTVSVLDAKNFEMRGYVDAGDLLRTEQSVQVEEVLSGKKTVSIRAGNPDEVIVMYNGVKMNSAYDNVFDLSLVDLEDVQRFEVIKGSNTALYGSDAFSGVINIVPKREQDYTLRLQQRFGTYASGNWGAHLYRNYGRAFGAYSYKRGAFERRFSGDDSGVLSNETAHQTATALLDISPNADGRDLLSVNYVRAELDYENARFQESLLNFNQLVSARYSGSRLIKDLSLTFGYQGLDETRFLVENLSLLSRDLDNRSLSFNLDKSFTVGQADLLFGYQLEQTTLDFLDDRPTDAQQEGVESAELSQQRNGGVAIAKFRANTGSEYLHTANFNVSFRYDAVRDRQEAVQLRRDSAMDSTGAFEENSWQEAMLKFSANLSGSRNDFAFNAFMNYGRNVKFPTLFQQISAPLADSTSFYSANLQPETSNGLEIGANFTWDTREHPAIYGVRLSGSFFRNTFSNKFVSLLTPASALVRYTNIRSAQISGAEAAVTFFLFRKKATLEAGTVFYSIPDLE
ncbi:MAG: TonB-dependent receptor plug domain-containing protein, partial [Calditrichota bacterium]